MKKIVVLLMITLQLFSSDFCEEPAYENEFEEPIEEGEFWLKANWGFEGSASLFDPDNITVEDGSLFLTVGKMGMSDEDGVFYEYTGAELKGMKEFGFGRYEIEVKFTGLEGLNETFLISWDGGNYAKHHEFMGFQFLEDSFRTLLSVGPDEDSDGSHKPELDSTTNQAKTIYKKSHTFAIDYTPTSIIWYYDDEPFRKEKNLLPKEKMGLVFRSWLPTSASHTINKNLLPKQTEYKYVRYYPTLEEGCEKITENKDDEIVETIDNSGETVVVSGELSSLLIKINSLPLNSVNLLGTTNAITDMKVFSDVVVVWVFNSGVWKAYSPDSSISNALESNGVEIVNSIPAHTGFWVQR